MINKLMQIIAPHYCYGCAKVGTVLCHECKYDISETSSDACLVCSRPARAGICNDCRSTYDRAWYVGDREGALRDLIDAFKFERVASASESLASLLDERLPVLPDGTIIVPVPTIASHIRQRGYDHTLRIARELARLRSLRVSPLLRHVGSNVQRGKSKRVRLEQAETSYHCPTSLNPDRTYLLIDDIVTTNATLRSCAAELRRAGARHVWVAVVARQALDK